jgi:cell division inhibitor SepF
MAGALRKTMVYLGLAEEDERYGSYDEAYEDDRVRSTRLPSCRPGRPVASVAGPRHGSPHRITTIHPRTCQRG